MMQATTMRTIKREVVSANLEVISEEKFARRREGISSCANCQKERSRNQRSKNRGKRKQSKAHTPIVIHLKDTLKALQRQKSYPDVEETSLNDINIASERFDPNLEHIHTTNTHQASKYKRIAKKDGKNFNAFLSVIEKAHRKNHWPTGMDGNLDLTDLRVGHLRSVAFTDNILMKLQSEFSLNNKSDNLSRVCNLNSKDTSKRRSIVECDNVDLICNDLTSSGDRDVDSPEESEVDSRSSSEVQSDSDISNPEGYNNDLGKVELKKLARYTTGIPLVRYDCIPSECPACLANYYNELYQNSCISPLWRDERYINDEITNEGNIYKNSDDVYLEISEDELDFLEQNVAVVEVKSCKTATVSTKGIFESAAKCSSAKQKQLCDIGIRRQDPLDENQCLNSVFIDLTDTDVNYTVYYHHRHQDPIAHDKYATHPPQGHSWMYQPSYYQAPIYPTPLYIPSDSLPKTLMIPPAELKNFTISQPPQRQWILLNHPERNRPTAIFTCMCYNVLCDKYCTRQLYGFCQSWALNWEYRKKSILEEIRNYSADLICLQEVETKQFYKYFLPELKQEGYDGIFTPKSRAKTMSEQERRYVDGCAIFYRTSKFSLMVEHVIEFNQIAMANAEGSDDMLNRVMTKDNIGLAALLETKEGVYENGLPPENNIRQPILVATCHIHWDPEFCDVKLIQTMMLMAELKKIVEDSCQSFRPGTVNSTMECNAIPLILCGDLNSLPDSGVIEFLTSGRVLANHIDFKELGYESSLQKLNSSDSKDALSHNFRLSRAYDDDTMPYTNFTCDFKGIIDYIFYSRDHLKLLGVLGPLEEEWIRRNKIIGCPQPHVPSDHFSLFVEFELPIPYPSSPGNNNMHNKLR